MSFEVRVCVWVHVECTFRNEEEEEKGSFFYRYRMNQNENTNEHFRDIYPSIFCVACGDFSTTKKRHVDKVQLTFLFS